MTTEFDYVEILRQCAQQRPEALRALYELEAAKLVGIAMRILRRRELAEDVVHDVFVQVWRKADTFDAKRGSAKAWLYTMTRYRALNLLRDGGRHAELDEADLGQVPDCAENPVETLARIEDEAELRRCLEQLDEMKRTTILLAYVDGYSQSQIAERLKVPLNTAKAWVRRGLLLLRDCVR